MVVYNYEELFKQNFVIYGPTILQICTSRVASLS